MDLYEQVYRCMPLWLLREYLEELGGTAEGEHMVYGEGWVAELTPLEPFELGSLRLGQVRLVIKGDGQTLERLKPALEIKTMRAGA